MKACIALAAALLLSGTAVAVQWQFAAPVSEGTLEVSVYQELSAVQVPVNLVLTKPY